MQHKPFFFTLVEINQWKEEGMDWSCVDSDMPHDAIPVMEWLSYQPNYLVQKGRYVTTGYPMLHGRVVQAAHSRVPYRNLASFPQIRFCKGVLKLRPA